MFRLFSNKIGTNLLKRSMPTNADLTKAINLPRSGNFKTDESSLSMFTLEERARRIKKAKEIDIPILKELDDELERKYQARK